MRRAITLIELLVVIFIILLITAIAIPMVIPSIEERRSRETSRLVTSHFQGARTRAIQTGRHFGVMIEPQAGLTDAGITLSYMAEAEPWQGDFGDSRAFIIGNLGGGTYALLTDFADGAGNHRIESGWLDLIRAGDEIQLNKSGRWYQITSGEPFTDSNGNGIWNNPEPYLDLDGDMAYDAPNVVRGMLRSLPWTLQASALPAIPSAVLISDVDSDGDFEPGDTCLNPPSFTVRRQPTKTAAHPLQLPNAMVIDLAYSGTSALPTMNGVGPITVLFSPAGTLKSVHYFQGNRGQAVIPTSAIYFLIGKIDKVGTVQDYQDAGNLWVTIHPMTGLISATEVGSDSDANGTVSLAESRQFAQRGLALGGR